MENQFSRTEKLIEKAGIEKLQNAKVAIFGIGGVRLIRCRRLSKSRNSEILY